MRKDPFESGRFPFEDTIRSRYSVFRTRERHGLATLLDLAWLIIVLSLIIFALIIVLGGLIMAMFAAPFVIVALAIARWLSPPRRRIPHGTIIDVEVDRR